MAPRQVSQATKALVNREEMDAALARATRAPPALRAPAAIRIHRVDTTSAAFLCAATLLSPLGHPHMAKLELLGHSEMQ